MIIFSCFFFGQRDNYYGGNIFKTYLKYQNE